jgi:TolB-like protein
MAAILALGLTATACSTYDKEPDFRASLVPDGGEYGFDTWPPKETLYTQRFIWKMRYLAEQLAGRMGSVRAVSPRLYATGHTDPRAARTLLMTTLVPVDDLYRSTSFGRLAGEQLMTELDHLGFTVIEARKTVGYFMMDGEGEFALSRNAVQVDPGHDADGVMVGTFSRSGPQMLINVRIVSAVDATILASATAQMDLRGDQFLSDLIRADEQAAASKNGASSPTAIEPPPPVLNLRKRVDEETDSYADTLGLMIRQMAQNALEAAPRDRVGPLKVVVATFVDVDNLYRTSTFGRYVSEQLMGDLASLGAEVSEIRLMPEAFVDIRVGELVLSREMAHIINERNADAYLVGTYARADDKVFVNARLALVGSRKVVGVGQMVVDAGQKNKFVVAMLENEITTVMPGETVEGY